MWQLHISIYSIFRVVDIFRKEITSPLRLLCPDDVRTQWGCLQGYELIFVPHIFISMALIVCTEYRDSWEETTAYKYMWEYPRYFIILSSIASKCLLPFARIAYQSLHSIAFGFPTLTLWGKQAPRKNALSKTLRSPARSCFPLKVRCSQWEEPKMKTNPCVPQYKLNTHSSGESVEITIEDCTSCQRIVHSQRKVSKKQYTQRQSNLWINHETRSTSERE